MIHRIFLLAISIVLFLAAGQKCPDHYNPQWFEEPSDEMALLIEEYFEDKNITFLPALTEIQKLGLTLTEAHIWQLPNSTRSYRDQHFPVTPGIWRYEHATQQIHTTHLLIREQTRLSETEAINVYNGLMGAYWNDYSNDGYQMTLEPEDSKIRYKNRYFELNVKIYGLKNDATNLPKTTTDIIFRDYTDKVKQFVECKEKE